MSEHELKIIGARQRVKTPEIWPDWKTIQTRMLFTQGLFGSSIDEQSGGLRYPAAGQTDLDIVPANNQSYGFSSGRNRLRVYSDGGGWRFIDLNYGESNQTDLNNDNRKGRGWSMDVRAGMPCPTTVGEAILRLHGMLENIAEQQQGEGLPLTVAYMDKHSNIIGLSDEEFDYPDNLGVALFTSDPARYGSLKDMTLKIKRRSVPNAWVAGYWFKPVMEVMGIPSRIFHGNHYPLILEPQLESS